MTEAREWKQQQISSVALSSPSSPLTLILFSALTCVFCFLFFSLHFCCLRLSSLCFPSLLVFFPPWIPSFLSFLPASFLSPILSSLHPSNFPSFSVSPSVHREHAHWLRFDGLSSYSVLLRHRGAAGRDLHTATHQHRMDCSGRIFWGMISR